MNDEDFEKVVEEVRSMNFTTEEEARVFFDKKIKEEWSKMRVKRPKLTKDEREKQDPYYAMLKD